MYGRHQNALRRMTSLLKGSGLSKGEAGALLINDAFGILKGEFSDLALCWLGMLVYRSTNSFSTKLPSHSWAGRHFQCPQASISNEK